MAEPAPSAWGRATSAGAPLAPFRHRVFQAIWVAMLLSNFGSMIQQVGAAWLMTTLTSSRQLVALVQASGTLPIMLLAVFSGAIADSYDRRFIMMIAQVAMLIASICLAALTLLGDITPARLLLMTLAVGLGTTLNGPAWQASLRMQVPAEDIPQAVSLNSISFNLARSVGPAIGGILISLAGPALNFIVNALSYVGIITVLWFWRPSQTSMRREPMFTAIKKGLDFCRSTPEMRHTLFRAALFGATGAALWSLMPLIARELLHGNQITYGLLLGAFGLGSICAALQVSKWRRALGSNRMVSIAAVAFAGGSIGAAWAPSLILAMPMTFAAGMGWVMALTSFNVTIQMRAPDAIVGRCLSIYHMCAFGGLGLGAYGWGALADAGGVRMTLGVSAVAMALSPLLAAIAPIPEPGARGTS